MTRGAALTRLQLDRVRAVAALLLPGSPESPSATSIPDFDALLERAAGALSRGPALAAAIDALPADPTWERLASFSEHDRDAFEQVALLVVGAYFMSASALASLGLPTGERRAAHREQVVDELSSGILDPVFERGSPVRTMDDVSRAARTA